MLYLLGIGDWGLGIGIGDWAQSPIPNPQSPNVSSYLIIIYYLFLLFINIKYPNKNFYNIYININIKFILFVNMPTLTIGIKKYNQQFSIPYEEDMTFGQFLEVMDKVLGFPCDTNIFEDKNKKMKDIVKGITNLTLLNNDSLLRMINH